MYETFALLDTLVKKKKSHILTQLITIMTGNSKMSRISCVIIDGCGHLNKKEKI